MLAEDVYEEDVVTVIHFNQLIRLTVMYGCPLCSVVTVFQ